MAACHGMNKFISHPNFEDNQIFTRLQSVPLGNPEPTLQSKEVNSWQTALCLPLLSTQE